MQTDLTVMITGESGTGKELVARALHDFGKRRNGPFVAINMAAIPRDLIEAELFGHEKGAVHTAPRRAPPAASSRPRGGTLFLDEIGDMPMDAQTRLLRVLQEGEYTMVGGRTPIKSNVRIVAATHRDLSQMIRQGLFREDLYYRLNVVPIRLPPLRERIDDIGDLVSHFLRAAQREGEPVKSIAPDAIRLMQDYSWPGNVRELENLVRRLAALYAGRKHFAGNRAGRAQHFRSAGGAAEQWPHRRVGGRSKRMWRNCCATMNRSCRRPGSTSGCWTRSRRR